MLGERERCRAGGVWTVSLDEGLIMWRELTDLLDGRVGMGQSLDQALELLRGCGEGK